MQELAGQRPSRLRARAHEYLPRISTPGHLRVCADVDGIETLPLDVTSSDAVAKTAGDLSAVDVLFNCAGVVHHGSILECDEDEFDRSVELNIKGTYRMTRAFLPAHAREGAGHDCLGVIR